MKRVSIWCFCIVFISVFLKQYSEYQHFPQALITGTMCAIVVCIIVIMAWWTCRLLGKVFSSISEKTKGVSGNLIDKTSNIISVGTVRTIDNSYYATAEQEIIENNFDKGLWSKAFVNAKGNEDLRRVEYIKLRAREIHQQQTKKISSMASIKDQSQTIDERIKTHLGKKSTPATIELLDSMRDGCPPWWKK